MSAFSFSLKTFLRHLRQHSNWGAELTKCDRRTRSVRSSCLKQNIHANMRVEGKHTPGTDAHGCVVEHGTTKYDENLRRTFSWEHSFHNFGRTIWEVQSKLHRITHVYDTRLCNLLKTFVLGIGRPTTRTASLASSAIRQRRDAWWATRNHSQRSPGGATGLCCFRVWGSFHWKFWGSFHWKEVILQRMTLNRSDKSLNCTYSTYSLLQGLRVPWIRCVCGSVFIILSDIRKLKWKHFLRIISKTFSLEWNSENGIHIQSRVYFLLWTSQ